MMIAYNLGRRSNGRLPRYFGSRVQLRITRNFNNNIDFFHELINLKLHSLNCLRKL